eukprot:2830482-Alexandrium_andersonii.AAC.1
MADATLSEATPTSPPHRPVGALSRLPPDRCLAGGEDAFTLDIAELARCNAAPQVPTSERSRPLVRRPSWAAQRGL